MESVLHELYTVVVNDEEQYSIWPEKRTEPLGWKRIGSPGPKEQCLEYIRQVWTDIRPKSVRDRLKKQSGNL